MNDFCAHSFELYSQAKNEADRCPRKSAWEMRELAEIVSRGEPSLAGPVSGEGRLLQITRNISSDGIANC
ncbi:MAG: hypothetical protein LBQ69_02970 [Treponema sp.]|nr:hypothetical protein [Treponema sp.]